MINPNLTHLECIICGKEHPAVPEIYTCSECGIEGILDAVFDLEMLKGTLSNSLSSRKAFNMWRYKELLPVTPTSTFDMLDLSVTPLYSCPSLKSIFGSEKIMVKDDGRQPTGSLKDRASAIGILMSKASHKDIISCSSTGNAASSLAGISARLNMPCVIFVPQRAPLPKIAQLVVFGANVFKVSGTYSQAFQISQNSAQKYNWYNRNCAINPYLVEGKKTVSLEIIEQMKNSLPDWLVVSVGDGCTVSGVCKGLLELYNVGYIDKLPRVLAVQSERADALYRAWKYDTDLKEGDSSTIADSIAVGYPRNWRKAIKYINQVDGIMLTVSDNEIVEMHKDIPRLTGIFSEPAASASFAGLKRAIDSNIISINESVVVISTGNGLKDINTTIDNINQPPIISTSIDNLEEHLSKLL